MKKDYIKIKKIIIRANQIEKGAEKRKRNLIFQAIEEIGILKLKK